MKKYVVIGGVVLVAAVVLALVFFRSGKEEGQAELPAAQLVDEADRPLDFSQFKGKVVFVNNWASWCPPCVAEMPSIYQLKGKLQDADVAFVMVSFDEDKDKAKAFMERRKFDFEIYYPGQHYPFFTSSIPATFILNKQGEVVSQHIGMADYSGDEVVEHIMALVKE